jgi:hypothetical protein
MYVCEVEREGGGGRETMGGVCGEEKEREGGMERERERERAKLFNIMNST